MAPPPADPSPLHHLQLLIIMKLTSFAVAALLAGVASADVSVGGPGEWLRAAVGRASAVPLARARATAVVRVRCFFVALAAAAARARGGRRNGGPAHSEFCARAAAARGRRDAGRVPRRPQPYQGCGRRGARGREARTWAAVT